jgi:hypothetical protein
MDGLHGGGMGMGAANPAAAFATDRTARGTEARTRGKSAFQYLIQVLIALQIVWCNFGAVSFNTA